MERLTTQVIVIGGGATGAGVLRDCALRGLDAILLEKDDLSAGTTGRNHGLLHSGARYAVTDKESAAECIAENRILRKIAGHTIEETGGLFVTLPGDDPDYHDHLLAACGEAGVPAHDIGVDRARRMEPNVNPQIVRALWVPDATIDPFRLTSANALDAINRGARVLTRTKVMGISVKDGRAAGVVAKNTQSGQETEISGQVIVNAAGVHGQHILSLANIDLPMFPSKGSMVIIDYRVNNMVINRCRPPADGDIIVPGDTVSLIGTTSKKIPYEQIDNLFVEDDEIEVLLADGEKLIPNVSRTRVLRAYAGVRPLVSVSGNVEGRQISRGIVLIDHKRRDNIGGLVTIAGGKLTTYRLMASMATDLVCQKLKVAASCTTHEKPLPGSEKALPQKKSIEGFTGASRSVVGATHFRHGERVRRILTQDPDSYGLVCECEMVTTGEVEYALKNLAVKDIVDLRRRTRLGMGPCQGALCAYRAAGLFNQLGGVEGDQAVDMLKDFLEERWKGIKPVLWGDALREAEFGHWIYQGLFGLDGDEP
jgi:glycerol-3-phosphate dehydrogenase